jgi:hypothetical protein
MRLQLGQVITSLDPVWVGKFRSLLIVPDNGNLDKEYDRPCHTSLANRASTTGMVGLIDSANNGGIVG